MEPTARTSTRNDVRLDFYRDVQGKWRWRVWAVARIVADSGEGYSRRIDCLQSAMRVVGADLITWLEDNPDYRYGQASRAGSVVSVFIWKRVRR